MTDKKNTSFLTQMDLTVKLEILEVIEGVKIISSRQNLMNNGAPLEVIQNLMGHEKSETTKIYAYLSGTLRRELYKKFF